MSVDTLLSRLVRFKRTRPNTWVACCPAHDDRGPSLSIRETSDGRILLHCFAGCSAGAILEALGLDMADLFPPRDPAVHHIAGERAPFPAHDVLQALRFEALVLWFVSLDLRAGTPLSDADQLRLTRAIARIGEACRLAGCTDEMFTPTGDMHEFPSTRYGLPGCDDGSQAGRRALSGTAK